MTSNMGSQSRAEARSDASLHTPFANSFAILSQTVRSALRRLSRC